MLDMDSPKGYVSRIRHTKPIQYPTCSEDYVARIGPLIELALIVKKKIEATLKVYQKNCSCPRSCQTQLFSYITSTIAKVLDPLFLQY